MFFSEIDMASVVHKIWRIQHVKGGGGQGAQTIQQVQQVPDLQLQPQLVCFVFCSKICCNAEFFQHRDPIKQS